MSKIGIDARMYGKNQSGIGTYIKQITDHVFELDKNNQYYIFLLDPIYSEYIPPHPNIKKVKATAYWFGYAEQINFLRQINKYKLDLMHFPNFNAPILYNRPRIHTIHDITPKFFPGHKQKSIYRKKAYELTIKTSLKKSAKLITISNNTKNDLIKYFSVKPEHINVTYLGIERRFKHLENYAKINVIKTKYGIKKPFIFFISVWRNHKNFEGLIKAFSIIKEKYNLDYQLVLGGKEDSHYPNIRQAILKSKYKEDIITPGFISNNDLPWLYNAASLFVLPSFYEGFGIIGLEAMACGTPVISSNSTCLPEIMGKAALYFEPEQPDEIALKIKQILTDNEIKEKLIEKGFLQTKLYSWKKCSIQTLDIYKKILKQ